MVNKKGFVYFIEIIFTVLIVFIIVAGFLGSRQEVFEYKKVADLREEAWSVLNNIDEVGTLERINYSELRDYIRESLQETVDFEMEYYNNTKCHNISKKGYLGKGVDNCLWINTTTQQDIVSTIYTAANNSRADSFKLYLWQKL